MGVALLSQATEYSGGNGSGTRLIEGGFIVRPIELSSHNHSVSQNIELKGAYIQQAATGHDYDHRVATNAGDVTVRKGVTM